MRADGSKKHTLLYLLDQTATAMGGRKLRAWIEQPLQNIASSTAGWTQWRPSIPIPLEREALGKALSSVYDIERLCSRIAYGSVNARDCQALARSLERIPELLPILGMLHSGELGPFGML